MAEANQIIFIEAFLASKKINWRCSYKLLFKALKTTITFWCFVFVTLFNLQGTRCVPQRFLMISLRFPFVKNFFQKFLNFFQVLSSVRTWSFISLSLGTCRPLAEVLAYTTRPRGVCQHFFTSFFVLFYFSIFASVAGVHPSTENSLAERQQLWYADIQFDSIYNV